MPFGYIYTVLRIKINPFNQMGKKEKQGCIYAIIPARFGSVRFPGKPLAKIHGKSLIQHTYENATMTQAFDRVVVATDHELIFEEVQKFSGEVVYTSQNCPTGTDRIINALKLYPELNAADIIVNLQGDEPKISKDTLEKIIHLLKTDQEAVISTAAVRILHKEEALSPSCVKCVLNKKGDALYFSRSLIPGNKNSSYEEHFPYYRHLGVYAFRREFLYHYETLSPTPLQLFEDLEQLKVLEHGFKIKVAIVESDSIGVDTPDDLKKFERLLCKQNTYL